jgi:hypothetical protein
MTNYRELRAEYLPGNLGIKLFAAILNNELESSELGNERWFVDEHEAIIWLNRQII